ncbi:oligoribonuclease [Cryobacterium sp. TMT1-21]|uniref:Oligoribonuclease n=1 Tax=Cryobacterium shii TaxID=1259235 RepID=A0AAQ2HGY1_9MICO|nr:MULTISPECIES: oligoribonuclease [Cryobacterium]TFC53146.1 oligoribonuclease [Cryobacterium shii]TFC87699.1 oligoribonuclease [Cryobacterium sp. TmT2-59]TFD10109.1 oligoribonuclease [Cryobacterium sp. TMT1-21]TFD20709.1 oligoribonuclease [Cryobacterium sp. TMT2-23]TFD22052.1 oligoribonuclease [Cryobacterium sp. TMT4-10]
MTKSSDRLVWVDCEMTGLDIDTDELCEIAVVITDYDLNIIDPGLDLVIKPSAAALENMNDFVRDMHETSGLITEMPNGLTAAEAELQVLDYVLKFIPADQKAPLAGNSIGTDRAFLTKYMPRLDNQLHYRNVDVSSIKELARRWYPRVYFNAPAKDGGHRALADILESIRELAYYRQTVFVSDPGPSSDQAKSRAAEAVHNFGPNM